MGQFLRFFTKRIFLYSSLGSDKRFSVQTTITKNVVIVNSRYWNRKELWGSNGRNDLLLLALTLHNIECRFIIYNVTAIQQQPSLVCYHS